ncbi:hypothetical protein MMAD_00070 [Mycolicibacterium madagascariense]|uniref:DNA polymerase III beta sliding clamp N-terminal domain-containing protein n=1 Tax=Mycolicibacterium madagascariense TaxID=212765 RepID=A0A7I7X8F1_9MYCO|nr:hypothetical protein MMAD_00070 [Mycolicibacterium madagascariense]
MDVATTMGTDLKFRLVREDFADAVAWVARILPTRPTVPVLSGVLLTGSDEGLTISGYDYEVSAEVRVAAEIATPGSVLVSGRLLSDITKSLLPSPSTSASRAPVSRSAAAAPGSPADDGRRGLPDAGAARGDRCRRLRSVRPGHQPGRRRRRA